jgi:uncharacterized protein (TIGR02118 family)
MIRVAVLYPNTNETHFDWDYYLTKHVPLAKARYQGKGLLGIQVDEGLGGAAPGQPAPFAAIFSMTFATIEDLQTAVSAHGAEVTADIPNFTNVQPLVQVSRIVVE